MDRSKEDPGALGGIETGDRAARLLPADQLDQRVERVVHERVTVRVQGRVRALGQLAVTREFDEPGEHLRVDHLGEQRLGGLVWQRFDLPPNGAGHFGRRTLPRDVEERIEGIPDQAGRCLAEGGFPNVHLHTRGGLVAKRLKGILDRCGRSTGRRHGRHRQVLTRCRDGPPMRVRRIDHVGIAVEDEDAARLVLEGIFGCKPPVVETVEDQGVTTYIYKVGDTKVELLVPTRPDSPVAKHLEKARSALHHLAFEVDDLEMAMEEATEQGLDLIDEEPRAGVEGSRIAFIHPKGTFRTLVELVDFPDDAAAKGGP